MVKVLTAEPSAESSRLRTISGISPATTLTSSRVASAAVASWKATSRAAAMAPPAPATARTGSSARRQPARDGVPGSEGRSEREELSRMEDSLWFESTDVELLRLTGHSRPPLQAA
jgi:hypothetical protein